MSYQPINIIPGAIYTSTEQYVVIDPTAPNHIHVRGGGAIDNCSAELYLGGEDNHFMVYDPTGTATITAQTSVNVAGVPLLHGSFGSQVMYLTLGADAIAAAGTTDLVLGAEGSFGTFKCIIHAKDATTGDTEAFEYLITQDGAGNIDDLAGTSVNSGGVGSLVTASTSIVTGDVTLTLTNVAVSTNDVNVRVQVTALALA